MASLVVLQPGLAAGESASEDDETGDDEEVVVVTAGEPPPEQTSSSRLDREQIDALGGRSGQDLLRSVPGLQLSQHGSEGKAAQFFMRGFDAAHGTDVTIGVDGLVLNEPSHIHGHGYADAGLIIPEAVRDVRVRKGAFGLDQGNLSTAGDVDYRLGAPDDGGVAAGMEAGWPARGRLWGRFAPEDSDGEDVVAAEVVGDVGPFENRHTRRGGFVGQHSVGDWRVRGAVQGASFGLPGAVPLEDLRAGRIDREESLTPDTDGETAQGWIGAVYEEDDGGWSRRTSIDVRARQFDAEENFTGYLLDEQRGDRRREFQRGIGAVARHRSDVDVGDGWEAHLLGGGSVDVFRQFEDAVDDRSEPIERNRGGDGVQVVGYLAPGMTGFVADWLEVHGGVRLEGHGFEYREDDQLGDDRETDLLGVVAPRGRLRLFPARGWTVVASGGRGFRGAQARLYGGDEPEVGDGGNSQLEQRPGMTVVDGAELGVVAEPVDEVRLAATAFGHVSDAEFVYDHVARRNVDEGATRRIGGELAGRVRIAERARIDGHVTAVDARFVDQGERIPFVSPVEAGIMAFGDGPAGTFGGLQWRGETARPLPFGARAGGWHLVDAHLGWRHDGWELRADVDNLLDADWNEASYHYASHFDRSQSRPELPRTHVVAGPPRMIRLQVTHRW